MLLLSSPVHESIPIETREPIPAASRPGMRISGICCLFGAAASTILFAGILLLEYFGYLPDYVLVSKFHRDIELFTSVRQFGTMGLTFFLGAFISAMQNWFS